MESSRKAAALRSICQACRTSQVFRNQTKVFQRSYSFIDQFDPPYLEDLKPEIPEYEIVNVQMKGYDFAVLENYQSLVHRIAKSLDIEVEEGWGTPATVDNIKKFKPNSANVDCEYKLWTYERNVQVVDVPSTKMTLFTELVQAALPQGVNLSVHLHEQEHEEIRYVPDYELKQLKNQLDDISQRRNK